MLNYPVLQEVYTNMQIYLTIEWFFLIKIRISQKRYPIFECMIIN